MPKITGGVWPAMLTPFNDQREPDEAQTRKLIDAHIEDGVDGLYVLGATGQGLAMRLDQRKRVAEWVCQQTAGRTPLIIHVGCLATDDAVELAQHAAKQGADGISAVPPVYFRTSAPIEMEHYRRIAEATDLPFFPYVNTTLTGEPPLPPREYVDRLLELPHIAGSKITTQNLYTFGLIRQHSAGRLTLFSGADELVCQAALCGADGAIGSFYNMSLRAVQAGRQALLGGDVATAMRFMGAFQLALEEVLTSGAIYSYFRTATRLRHNVDIGPSRAPDADTGKSWSESATQKLLDRIDEAAGVMARR